MDYERKLEEEIENYRQVENVHDLPDIFHYWSNKHLLPMFREFGFSSLQEFYLGYLERACRESPDGRCRFLSVGSGNCDVEVALAKELMKAGHDNFLFECLELNRHMIKRGTSLAKEAGVLKRMVFVNKDIASWKPEQQYHVVIASQSLHHFVELEALFDGIAANLSSNGYFLTQDTIGRNGHMRWPEVLEIIAPIWAGMPDRCKYNHQLKRLEDQYINWDCSSEGLEGIRAQDILPLLVQRFHFEKFLAWGGVTDLFVDRGFGHNFDAGELWDRTFIDMLHYLSMYKLLEGGAKPTQMVAAMTLRPVPQPLYYRNMSPAFCLRQSPGLSTRPTSTPAVPSSLPEPRGPSAPELRGDPPCERGQDVARLEAELEGALAAHGALEREFDERGQWALGLQREVEELRAQLKGRDE